MNKAQQIAITDALVVGQTNKSEAMRMLDKAGFTRGDISRILTKAGLRASYQYVNNVLTRGAPKKDLKQKRINELEALVAKLQAENKAAKAKAKPARRTTKKSA